jgi:diphthamide biosynthesis protein 2
MSASSAAREAASGAAAQGGGPRLSHSAEDAIHRRLEAPSAFASDLPPIDCDDGVLAYFFEVARTADFVRHRGAKRVCLQFPDSFLGHASRLAALLARDGACSTYVLADTSFSPCCVDEVAAKHVAADAVVHYGDACLSRSGHMPVCYVFGRAELVVDEAAERIASHLRADATALCPCSYTVFYKQQLAHAMPALEAALGAKCGPALRFNFARLAIDGGAAGEEKREDGASCVAGFLFRGFEFGSKTASDAPGATSRALFVGDEGPELTTLMINLPHVHFLRFCPRTSKLLDQRGANVNRLLSRRFYLMQKAKDAQIIGLVAGTLSAARYLEVLAQLATTVRSAGKRCYRFLVGKLNDPKLSNFAEVDVYVLVSCPFSCLVDSSSYFKSVITPAELFMALSPGFQWTGQYSTELDSILPGGVLHEAAKRDEERHRTLSAAPAPSGPDADAPEPDDEAMYGVRYSLVTGKLVSAKRPSQADASSGVPVAGVAANATDGNRAVALTTADSQVSVRGPKSAADVLAQRSFKGLEFSRASEPSGPAPIEKGLEGTARMYREETALPARKES